ncbi:MAG: (Fe-S)-binding protein [Desulfobacteraceae bacterium]|nr:(Fe-S)-binding protein [Desulfobacteraceae bacterium]
MVGMKALAHRVNELEEQLVICIRCGMCQAVCPLFGQTGKEADVARGKLALLDGLTKNMFEDAHGVAERINRCLLCGSCAANCPSGVNALEIFIRARAILTEFQGLSPLKKAVFRGMLAKPATFDRLTQWAGRFQGLFTRKDDNSQGTACARVISPLLRDRHFLPMADKPFHREVPKLNTAPGRSGLKVAFFTGCLVDKIFPGIGFAALEVFEHHGVGVYIPESLGCCGIPALASGDAKTFDALVAHNIDLLRRERVDAVVTACATCTSTVKKLWPTLYRPGASSLTQYLRELSEKTFDISEFLVNRIGLDPELAAGEGGQVTYHDPCHLKKSLGVTVEPRKLLACSGSTVVEMEGADKCCGMGGSFNLFHYDISSRIGNAKQQAIVDTGCSTVATGCPACMMQISDMLAKNGVEMNVKHPIEIYAESLKQGVNGCLH